MRIDSVDQNGEHERWMPLSTWCWHTKFRLDPRRLPRGPTVHSLALPVLQRPGRTPARSSIPPSRPLSRATNRPGTRYRHARTAHCLILLSPGDTVRKPPPSPVALQSRPGDHWDRRQRPHNHGRSGSYSTFTQSYTRSHTQCDEIVASISALNSVDSWEKFRRSLHRTPDQTLNA